MYVLHVRFDSVWLLSTLDRPWEVYQHFDWFWPFAVTGGLSALDRPWEVYQHFDWFWPLQSQEG